MVLRELKTRFHFLYRVLFLNYFLYQRESWNLGEIDVSEMGQSSHLILEQTSAFLYQNHSILRRIQQFFAQSYVILDDIQQTSHFQLYSVLNLVFGIYLIFGILRQNRICFLGPTIPNTNFYLLFKLPTLEKMIWQMPRNPGFVYKFVCCVHCQNMSSSDETSP